MYILFYKGKDICTPSTQLNKYIKNIEIIFKASILNLIYYKKLKYVLINNMLSKCELYILNSSCTCEMSKRIVVLYVNIRLYHHLKNINHTLRDNNIIRKLKIHSYK